MDVLQKIREEIDAIDAELMPLLEKRLQLSLDVIKAKMKLEKEIYDPSRELVIFTKCDRYQYSDSMKSIYSEIMKQSKYIQNSRR